MANSTHAPEDRLGSTVANRYRLDKVLGEGGFGAVYVATRDDGTRVALKVLAEDALERVGGDDRFRREAELARRMDHPNVVKVLDEGIDEAGTRYIAFELLEGRSLADELGRWGAMQPQRAAHIASAILDALEAAHQIGIIHRDLKPANVFLLDGSDRLKVLDFGIAKSINKNTIAGLTHAGQVLGTPAYMAVEQLTGDPVTPATDLFALGVLLVEMLLGKAPYPIGSTAMDIVRSRLTGLELELPADLARNPLGQIALQATKPHPLERYQSVTEMRRALQEAMRSPALVNTAPNLGTAMAEAQASFAPTGASGPHPYSPGMTTPGAPPANPSPVAMQAGFTQPGGAPAAMAPPIRQSSGAGAILGAAVVIGSLAIAGVGIGLWMGADDADTTEVSADESDEDEDEGEEPDRKKKRRKKRKTPRKRDRSEAVAPPDPIPPPPVPPPPTPIPTTFATRVLSCNGAARQNTTTLRSHLTAIGWTVSGTSLFCVGSMVNFRCIGPQGRGVTAQNGAMRANVVVVRFPSAAAAKTHADAQRGKTDPSATTWATDGAALLYMSMPDLEADKLMARVCK